MKKVNCPWCGAAMVWHRWKTNRFYYQLKCACGLSSQEADTEKDVLRKFSRFLHVLELQELVKTLFHCIDKPIYYAHREILKKNVDSVLRKSRGEK